ncbi:MAG: hypothetical protein IJJ30_06690 [Erysipelotrichaceae bacterium]|nr:hypothetical protein [Erysipelotrichaceae bacterium]
MSKAYFMGIDTGTNSSKGVLIDETGRVIAQASATHSLMNPAPGHYEHDAEKDWWGDLCLISKKLIADSGVDPADIKAVGTSALGADCLPVDENCRPLRKAILYGIDARAVDEMAQLTEMYGEEQIRKWCTDVLSARAMSCPRSSGSKTRNRRSTRRPINSLPLQLT